VIYNDDKTVKQRVELSHRSGNLIAEIEPNDWHTLEILEPDTVFIEVKKGPYIPFLEIDLL
ncbi:MAG: WbuC family cupin fold metalloprotein, partial [Tannerellaceae bacterium]